VVNPAAEAVASQGAGGYYADTWFNIRLEPMTKVWQGIGGHSNFFLSEKDAREASGAFEGSQPYKFAETLWRMAQVQASATRGFRNGIQEFVVDIATAAACAICVSNPGYGTGSVFQYYIPNWEKTLYSTSRIYRFSSTSYNSAF
jgi:hypothetical protein